MRRLISVIVLLVISIISLPTKSLAAGISASGGGAKTIGQTFTVNIVASGAEFNAFQGSISISGPLSVVSVTPGSANWMSQPAANGSFSGALLGQKVSSFTIATLKLKANSEGSGTVNVSNVVLKNGASTVGTSGDSANFTIEKAPDLPGAVKVSSSSHPDSNVAYEATTIALNWNKDSGVDGFSYALDQTANTKPEATIKDANTSVTFADKAVGTYYFHIRAHKPDGWGTTTHFKVNIKEPEAKVDEGLSKPHDIKIDKAPTFVDNVRDGTVSGVIISGVTEPEFSVNIYLTPVPVLPEGKTMSVLADVDGKFQLLIDFPIVSGFHKLTIQGQKEKILTPISDEVRFEISQAKGGSVSMISDEDIVPPAPVKAEETSQPLKLNKQNALYLGASILGLAIIIILIVFFNSKRKNGQILKSLKNK